MSKREQVLLTNDYVSKHAIELGKVLQRAINDALSTHKRLGHSIATWKDGKVVIVPPEEIVIPTDVPEANE
ncbi:MAG: hypothetical protein QOD75_501 [Blastocatellia bacterium]|nr:hypothetical protein [Blastocatellia bacterium]